MVNTPNKSSFGSLRDVNIDTVTAQVTLTSADQDVISSIKKTSKSNRIKKSTH